MIKTSSILAILVVCLIFFGVKAFSNSSAAPACIASPCQVTTNIAWDSAGYPDTRPGTWGNTDAVESQIPFLGVPAGYAVEITHVSGDEIAAPHGAIAANSMAYGLVGLTNSTPNQSPYVGPGLGSQGTFIYKQMPIPAAGVRVPIDENVLGTLNADNIAIIKQALFLDTAGVPEHFEATLTLQFFYVPTK